MTVLPCPRRNKRRILRIFPLPPAAETPAEPNFYNSMKKIRLRQQLEMYSIGKGGSVRPRGGSCVGRPCRGVRCGLALRAGVPQEPRALLCGLRTATGNCCQRAEVEKWMQVSNCRGLPVES